MTVRKREFFKDVSLLRIIALLLVILGHAVFLNLDDMKAGLLKWLVKVGYMYSFIFVIPLFIFISGYMYHVSRIENPKDETTRQFLLRRVKRLLIPYFLIGLLTAAALFIIGDYTTKSFLWDYFHDFILSTRPQHLWFILALVNIFFIHIFLKRFVRNDLIILAISLGLYSIYPVMDVDYIQLRYTLQYLPFFQLGFMARTHFLKMRSHVQGRDLTLFIGFFFLTLLLFLWLGIVGFSFIPIAFLELELVYLARLAIALTAIIYMFLGARVCTRWFLTGIDEKTIRKFYRYLFTIYLYHYPVILVLSLVTPVFGLHKLLEAMVDFLLTFIISLGLAIVTHKVIDHFKR